MSVTASDRGSTHSLASSAYLLTDTKAKKNAICPEWPNYLARSGNTIMINKSGQMTLKKNITDKFLAP